MAVKKTGLELLREPFPPHQISKLPKPTKKQTEEVKADYSKGKRCDICGTWHHPQVVHLDYVGHAALTDRLLDCDPHWVWEPLAVGPDGYPVIDRDGGMWIKLTVCGVTRLGYGDAQGKTGGDAMKERIGDALRNAAMRFGAALDLWHKGELHAEDSSAEAPPTKEQQTESDGLSEGQKHLLSELGSYCKGNRERMAEVLKECSHYEANGKSGSLSLDDVKKKNSNDKFQRWVGSTLGKLREKTKQIDLCNECRQPMKNGACRNLSCPEGRPE